MTRNEIDRQSIEKAKKLFLSGKVYDIEVGTTAGLRAIHHAELRYLLQNAMTTEADDRDVVFHGLEQSYYYEGYEPE